jgi:PAS domain S-box-containing protein
MTETPGASVLHVDDDPALAELTAEMLSEHEAQFTVETATNASEGRDRLATRSFDCIVSDYDMPGQNGIEFLETVREKHPNLPFILYTGKGSEAVASDAIAAGVTDYLQKESGTSQYTVLANKIRNAVERYRQQERAQATRDRLRQIIDLLPQLVFVKDEGGEFLLANEATAEAYGTTVSDLEGATDADFADSEAEIEQFRADDQAVIESGEPKHVPEESLTTEDGETRLLETTKIPYDPVETTGDAVLGISMDITERKERENMLRRYQYAFESALSGIAITDLDGELIDVNPAFVDMWGYDSTEDAIGRPAVNMWKHPEQAQSVLETITERGRREDELEALRADGSTFYARGVNSYLTDSDGDPIGVIASFFDITDRKKREAELERKQEFLKQTQNVADVGGWELDLRTDSLRWTDEVYRIHGVGPEFEPTVEDALTFHDPEDQAVIRDAIERVTTAGEPYDLELRIVTADDEVRWVSARAEPRYEDGEIVGVRGTFQDITERIEREQELEEKTAKLDQLAIKYERQYRTLFEEAPVMTALTRPENGQPIIEDCNSQFAETLGYDAEAMIGRGLAEFYTPESAERLLSQGYSQALNGQFTREKRELLTMDGERIETLLRAVPRRRADGEIIGTVAMYIDISARESVKRANERLEEFASVVSHDLRNPLNVATGRLELVAEECDSDHLSDLEAALDRMETLIDDLLTLAREGKDVTDAQPVDLSTVVNGCWENVETNQARLITDIDGDVCADNSRLKQVLENLFRNAVEHGRADVTVTVGRLDDGFYIEDDGPGIPSDERDAVFDAGYSQSTDGTGFGLSIVKQIINAHDWQIRIVDGSDEGARFEITNVEFVTVQGSPSSADPVEDE